MVDGETDDMVDGKTDIDQDGKMKSEEDQKEENDDDQISVSSLLDLFQLFLVRWEMVDEMINLPSHILSHNLPSI